MMCGQQQRYCSVTSHGEDTCCTPPGIRAVSCCIIRKLSANNYSYWLTDAVDRRQSTALTWSRWGCRWLADNIRLLAHDNNNNYIKTQWVNNRLQQIDHRLPEKFHFHNLNSNTNLHDQSDAKQSLCANWVSWDKSAQRCSTLHGLKSTTGLSLRFNCHFSGEAWLAGVYCS